MDATPRKLLRHAAVPVSTRSDLVTRQWGNYAPPSPKPCSVHGSDIGAHQFHFSLCHNMFERHLHLKHEARTVGWQLCRRIAPRMLNTSV